MVLLIKIKFTCNSPQNLWIPPPTHPHARCAVCFLFQSLLVPQQDVRQVVLSPFSQQQELCSVLPVDNPIPFPRPDDVLPRLLAPSTFSLSTQKQGTRRMQPSNHWKALLAACRGALFAVSEHDKRRLPVIVPRPDGLGFALTESEANLGCSLSLMAQSKPPSPPFPTGRPSRAQPPGWWDMVGMPVPPARQVRSFRLLEWKLPLSLQTEPAAEPCLAVCSSDGRS